MAEPWNPDDEDFRAFLVQWWTQVSTMPVTGERPPPTARDRLIDAAFELLLEDGRTNLLETLRVQRVARQAGASRQSWHNNFRDDDFLAAVSAHAADLDGLDRTIEVFGHGSSYLAANQEIATFTVMRSLLAATFELQAADPLTRIRLLLTVAAPNDEAILAPLRERHTRWRAASARTYVALIERAGQELQAPYDADALATAMDALLDGFLVRRLLEHDRASGEDFAEVAIALFQGALAVPATTDAETVPAVTVDGPRAVAMVSTDTIVTATVRRLRRDGTDGVRLEDIASDAGCSADLLRARYGSLDGLVAEAWGALVLDDLRLAAQLPARPVEQVRACLDVLASRCVENYWLTAALLRGVVDRSERPLRRAEPVTGGATAAAAILGEVLERSGHDQPTATDASGPLAARLVRTILLEVTVAGPPVQGNPLVAVDVVDRLWNPIARSGGRVR